MNSQILEQVLDVLTNCVPEDPQACEAAIQAVRQALADAALDKMADNARELGLDYEQPAQEPVAHSVIAGALFDFMGWLTTRKEKLVLSSSDDASSAVAAITEFAKMRELSLDGAKVTDWNTTPPAPAQPLTERQRWDMYQSGEDMPTTMASVYMRGVQDAEAAHGITKGGE